MKFPKSPVLPFAILTAALFAVSYESSPRVLDDSRDYLECARRFSIPACLDAPRARADAARSLPELLRADRCFYRLNRPFVLPLLLRLFGRLETYNLFQNVLRTLAWGLLGFGALRLGLHPLLKGALLLLLVRSGFTATKPFSSAILTEDMNLSLWVLNLALLLYVLYAMPKRRRLLGALIAFNLVLIVLVFLRSPNLVAGLVFTPFLYVAAARARDAAGLSGRSVVVAALFSLVVVALGGLSISASRRHLHTFTNQILFQMAGKYTPWPREEYPGLYRYHLGDEGWFLRAYPELEAIEAPGGRRERLDHPFVAWQIRSAGPAWTRFVLEHLPQYAALNARWLAGEALGSRSLSLGAAAFVVLLVAWRKGWRERWREALLLGAPLCVALAASFTALTADFPGELARHTHLARVLLALVALLSIFFLLEEGRRRLSRRGHPWKMLGGCGRSRREQEGSLGAVGTAGRGMHVTDRTAVVLRNARTLGPPNTIPRSPRHAATF